MWYPNNTIAFAWILCSLLSALIFQVATPNAVGAELVGDKRAVAVLAYQVGGLPKASLSLGSLATGESTSIKIDLQNALDNNFEFAEIKTSCSCKRIAPSKGKIKPGGLIELDFTLDIPKHLRGVARRGLLEFVDARGKTVGLLEFSFANPGYIGFKTDLLIVDYNSDVFELEVLLDVGEAVEKNKYRLVCDRLSISEGIDSNAIALTATVENDSALSGRIPLKLIYSGDDGDSLVDTLVLIIQKKADLEIAPKVIRLQVSEDQQFLTGAVFLRFLDNLEVTSATASLEIDGKSHGFTVKKLSKGAARLGLKIPTSHLKEFAEERATGVVQLRCGDVSAKQTVWLVFPSL